MGHILTRLGAPVGKLKQQAGANDIFAKSLALVDNNGTVVLEFGLVKKALTAAFDISAEVYFADINWTLLMKKTKKHSVNFTEISKFPAVSRDLALLVDKSVEFARIEQIAFAADKKFLKKVTLFDVYEGKNLEAGKKSYAVNFLLQDDTKTMNDKQTDAVMAKIIASLEKQLGAKLG